MPNDINVTGFLHQLRQALPIVPPIDWWQLRSLRKAHDYEGMVRLIKASMKIETNLRVGWVNSGGKENAPAWINLPAKMPFYGSKEFREMTITMFLRRSFLDQSSYDQVAMAIAHELSHVVLESIGHPLRDKEKAIDLTAMLLGFRDLYKSGCYKEERLGNVRRYHRLGYLTQQEVERAHKILRSASGGPWPSFKTIFHRAEVHSVGKRDRAGPVRGSWRATIKTLSALSGCILLISVAIPSVEEAYRRWQLHRVLLGAQTETQKQLPQKLGGHTTWTGVQVGFLTWTSLLDVTIPKGNIDVSALEQDVRRSACAGEQRSRIKDGVSYNYEYRDLSGELFARVEVTSCP